MLARPAEKGLDMAALALLVCWVTGVATVTREKKRMRRGKLRVAFGANNLYLFGGRARATMFATFFGALMSTKLL